MLCYFLHRVRLLGHNYYNYLSLLSVNNSLCIAHVYTFTEDIHKYNKQTYSVPVSQLYVITYDINNYYKTYGVCKPLP